MKIIPAILVKSEIDFKKQIQAIASATDLIHLDIADGQFVPETTWADPEVVRSELKIDCELHLMVVDPLAEIKRWINVPQVKRILFHVESPDDLATAIEAIHTQGWKATAVLNPETPGTALELVAEKLDGVMAMSIHPGAQGRPFMSEVLPKLTELKQKYPYLLTQVDGGINKDTLPQVAAAGIDAACVGSAIFGQDDPVGNLNQLKKLIA